MDVREDARGNFWIGSGGGLLRLRSITDDTIEVEVIGSEQGLKNIHILSITEDKVGNLWLGTAGGVSKLKVLRNEPLEVSVTNYTVKDGLSSDTPYLQLIDSKGDLWVGTNRGLDRFYIRQGEFKKIRFYDKDQGFSGIECNHNAGWVARNGNLWFGTMGGALNYNGREDKPNLTEPLLRISELKLYYEKINPVNFLDKENIEAKKHSSLLFNYNQNHLTFEFIGVSLNLPERVMYQYMLKGLDKDWSPVTRENDATYSNLLPGGYIFMVKACNEEGIWNRKPAEISFTIKKQYWETGWFYTLQILFFVLLIGTTFYLHRSNVQTRITTTLVFVTLFITFEYLEETVEPYLMNFTGGAPLFKVITNLILASILLPLEHRVKKFLAGLSGKGEEGGNVGSGIILNQ